MRNKDQILLESLYSKLIKENHNQERWNRFSEEQKKTYPWMEPNWSNGLIIPDELKGYFPDRPGSVTVDHLATAFYDYYVFKKMKCPYKIYQIFVLDDKDWDKNYLWDTEINGLKGSPYDSNMAEQNKDVNVMTIMNQILYPIKDMDQNYFNDVYENLFRTMAVEDYGDKGKSAYLFTNKNTKYKNILIDYFGENGFSIHRQFLIVLSQMIVNEFGNDPEINKDYSVLLAMATFAY